MASISIEVENIAKCKERPWRCSKCQNDIRGIVVKSTTGERATFRWAVDERGLPVRHIHIAVGMDKRVDRRVKNGQIPENRWRKRPYSPEF